MSFSYLKNNGEFEKVPHELVVRIYEKYFDRTTLYIVSNIKHRYNKIDSRIYDNFKPVMSKKQISHLVLVGGRCYLETFHDAFLSQTLFVFEGAIQFLQAFSRGALVQSGSWLSFSPRCLAFPELHTNPFEKMQKVVLNHYEFSDRVYEGRNLIWSLEKLATVTNLRELCLNLDYTDQLIENGVPDPKFIEGIMRIKSLDLFEIRHLRREIDHLDPANVYEAVQSLTATYPSAAIDSRFAPDAHVQIEVASNLCMAGVSEDRQKIDIVDRPMYQKGKIQWGCPSWIYALEHVIRRHCQKTIGADDRKITSIDKLDCSQTIWEGENLTRHVYEEMEAFLLTNGLIEQARKLHGRAESKYRHERDHGIQKIH